MNEKLVVLDELLLSNCRIVVYDGYYLNQNTNVADYENIICYDKNDVVLWKVNGDLKYWDHGVDSFVGISLRDNGTLVGTSFSGNTYRIDINTGKAVWDRFVK